MRAERRFTVDKQRNAVYLWADKKNVLQETYGLPCPRPKNVKIVSAVRTRAAHWLTAMAWGAKGANVEAYRHKHHLQDEGGRQEVSDLGFKVGMDGNHHVVRQGGLTGHGDTLLDALVDWRKRKDACQEGTFTELHDVHMSDQVVPDKKGET
jgi:hypothetical protein